MTQLLTNLSAEFGLNGFVATVPHAANMGFASGVVTH